MIWDIWELSRRLLGALRGLLEGILRVLKQRVTLGLSFFERDIQEEFLFSDGFVPP